MKVEVVRAWPRGFASCVVELPDGATVADAIAASGFGKGGAVAHAVFGVRVDGTAMLHDGDRVELLRPLLADPKDARRQRAVARKS